MKHNIARQRLEVRRHDARVGGNDVRRRRVADDLDDGRHDEQADEEDVGDGERRDESVDRRPELTAQDELRPQDGDVADEDERDRHHVRPLGSLDHRLVDVAARRQPRVELIVFSRPCGRLRSICRRLDRAVLCLQHKATHAHSRVPSGNVIVTCSR